jgi:hypothetical protein
LPTGKKGLTWGRLRGMLFVDQGDA